MNSNVKLSGRLETVASFIPRGVRFADIGSDHAYLPCHVCKVDLAASAIAGEVNRGPFDSAVETVKRFNLTDRVDVRLGDGLSVVGANEVSTVVIAGMGGALIRTILDEGKSRLSSVNRIITQPNVDERQLRQWLYANDYRITDEEILEENGHIYEIIVADINGKDCPEEEVLPEQHLLFGPVLLRKKPGLFFRKWEYEAAKRKRVIGEMKKAQEPNFEKLRDFEKELSWIEEVLADGSNNS